MSDATLRVIIAGSRNIGRDEESAQIVRGVAESVIELLLTDYCRPIEIVSGGCRGVDACGEALAIDRGWRLTVMPADWDGLGRSAGPIRNRAMASYASRGGEDIGAAIVIRSAHSRGSES